MNIYVLKLKWVREKKKERGREKFILIYADQSFLL